ncbi:hypothetical protein [Yersinia enterocolitica]|uniref:hypothetical protein n=1 Tax=Yersinia enterocolitica TaxID=630 RepID=UPI003D7BBC3A
MLSKDSGRVEKDRLEYLSVHNGKAVTIGGLELSLIATEVLSLREQLAELNRVAPSFYVLKTAYEDAWGDVCDLRCYEDETDVSKAKDDFGGVIIPLFTAAKPAEE